MLDRLPELFDPREFVERKRRIKGSIPLARLDRLRDVLSDSGGEAKIDLAFGKEGRIGCISGTVEADLPLQCQCCLETMLFPVQSDVRLGVVGSIDEANLLPEDLEPILVNPGAEVALADVVQDELLLAVPAIPRHTDCRIPGQPDAEVANEHPFAALANLKKPSEE
jgi:uncharacterized protein